MDCVIFDLDGTLADVRHRLHHVRKQPPDWPAFFDACVDDDYHEYVRILNHMVASEVRRRSRMGENQLTVFVCSGRPDSHRRESAEWLKQCGVFYDVLLMRAAGDHRPDVVIKKEMLDSIRGQGYSVLFAVDDRPSVVRMWRENGVPCFACDDSEWKHRTSYTDDLEGRTLLTLMVGPTHAGKDTWLWSYLAMGGPAPGHTLTPDNLGIHPEHVISSDQVREDLGITEYDRDSNQRTFRAVHSVARMRLEHGLPTVINATNIRRQDRLTCVDLAPAGTRVRYGVVDRPLAEKLARVRLGFPEDVIRRQDQTFRSQLDQILDGDGRPEVEVVDLRTYR